MKLTRRMTLAAFAGMLRVAVSGTLYHFLSGRMLAFSKNMHLRVLIPLVAALLALLAFQIPMNPFVKAFLVVIVAGTYAGLAWAHVLEEKDKRVILKYVGRGTP